MSTVTLSDSALALLRRRTSGESVQVTDETRADYRELVEVGIMISGHSFQLGRDSVFKFTEEGWAFATATWPEESALPRR